MRQFSEALRESDGLRYNGTALAYATGGYVTGIAGLTHENILVNLAATLLLAHAMTIAAYLVHECGHNLVFRRVVHNARLGTFLCWLCGACYGTYEDIRYKHFRHHIDNDDVVWFDYEQFFRDHPLILRVTRVLEWLYVPAHDLIMHFIMVFTSFIIPERRAQRRRNVTVLVVRGGIFIAVLIMAPKIALLYAIAYMLMITVLRFMDSVQHDYSYNLTLFEGVKSPRRGDVAWEQAHTFSNPISVRYAWPNWLTLNFGFHNAHHDDMTVPWYRLPDRHRALYEDPKAAVVPFGAQLKIFRKQRVRRIIDNHDAAAPTGNDYLKAAQRAEVYGGNAASFLTSF